MYSFNNLITAVACFLVSLCMKPCRLLLQLSIQYSVVFVGHTFGIFFKTSLSSGSRLIQVASICYQIVECQLLSLFGTFSTTSGANLLRRAWGKTKGSDPLMLKYQFTPKEEREIASNAQVTLLNANLYLIHADFDMNGSRQNRTCAVLRLNQNSDVIFFCPVPTPKDVLMSLTKDAENIYIVSPIETSCVKSFQRTLESFGRNVQFISNVDQASDLPSDVTLTSSGAWGQPDLWMYYENHGFLAMSQGIVGEAQPKCGFKYLDNIYKQTEGAKTEGYVPFSYMQYLQDHTKLKEHLRAYLPLGIGKLCSHVGGMCLTDDAGALLQKEYSKLLHSSGLENQYEEALIRVGKLSLDLSSVHKKMKKETRRWSDEEDDSLQSVESDDSEESRSDSREPSPEEIVDYVRQMSEKIKKDAELAVAHAVRKRVEGECINSTNSETKTDYEKGMKAMIFNKMEKRWLLGEIVTSDGSDVSVNVYKNHLCPMTVDANHIQLLSVDDSGSDSQGETSLLGEASDYDSEEDSSASDSNDLCWDIHKLQSALKANNIRCDQDDLIQTIQECQFDGNGVDLRNGHEIVSRLRHRFPNLQ